MPLTRKQKKDLNITDLETYAMASEEAINAKFEAFQTRMEDRIHALVVELNLGQPQSLRRSQQGESSYHKEDFQEKGGPMTDPYYPHMRVDFPRWEEGDPIDWISCAERYFRYHKTPDASMVDIATIHLEGDVIQWFDWFKYTHGALLWR
ncbi:hypothetical protein OPV22_013900 [Ensete ventricosum]|uniref:Retrotransposon gag domain-containing protein n=1 Tax=Ensete ventricosum TaxID=4639 RepID=A0AAV8R214_ENSVE|nr:hypothetical protein OPV22_013900 [Ensete ventricosum]